MIVFKIFYLIFTYYYHIVILYKNWENNLRHKSPKVMFNEGKFYHIDNKTFLQNQYLVLVKIYLSKIIV